MKPAHVFLIFVVLIALMIYGAVKVSDSKKEISQHICIDPLHKSCDGLCECDGLECSPHFSYQLVPLRDYQLEIVEDSILLFDGRRHVGTISFQEGTKLEQLIVSDNE
jgi:hypothetical protein